MALSKKHKKSMLDKIIEATLAFAKANGYIEKPKEVELNKRDKEILSVLKSSDFEGRQKSIARLMGAITGTNYQALLDSTGKIMDLNHKFAAVVVLDRAGSSYEKDKVVVVCTVRDSTGSVEYAKAVGEDGLVGNWLPYSNKKHLRPATAKEISEIPESQIDNVVTAAGIVFI